jgi:signal transduction histidine kinase
LLVGSALIARGAGVHTSALPLIGIAALAAVGVLGLVAFARLSSAPPQLRTLRILAILLPTLFIVCIEAILLVVEADELFTEFGEHTLVTAILSLCTIPFSLWVFGSFAALRDQLARRAESLETLHRVSQDLAAETSGRRLPAAIAEGARAVVGAERAVLLLAPEGEREETILADPADPPPDVEELAQLRGSVGTADGWLLARARGGAAHAVLVRPRGERPFAPEDALVLDMFLVAAAAAVENAERLEEAQQVATVEERERIARDLHDDLGQLLGFLTAKIQAAHELVVTHRDAEAKEELEELEQATRTLSMQVRDAILGLRTSPGPDRPLGRALEEFTAEFGIQAGLRTTFEGSPTVGSSLAAATQYQVIRIAQEAMANARRHADARAIAVSLREHDGVLELIVCDDGRGFSLETAAMAGRFGLTTMAERARAVGGTLRIDSDAGTGTAVHAVFPIAQAVG